jgi:tetratricopeptide (TPR) repeat protein
VNLSEGSQADVLRWAAYRLGALGYVQEAMEPSQAALERYYVQGNWAMESVSAYMLSQYAILLGDLDKARSFAQQAMDHGQRAGNIYRRIAGMASLGRAHFVAGNSGEAEECFLAAERWQRERQPQIPLLSSTLNSHYCEWLLSRGRCDEVRNRIKLLMEVRESPDLLGLIHPDEWTLTSSMNKGLDYLCLGRSFVVQARMERSSCQNVANDYLDKAIDLLYDSRDHSLIPFALLARADLRLLLEDFDGAAADLAQVQELALFGGMRLYQADGLLEAARLHFARYRRGLSADQLELARQSLAEAKHMYTFMGYGYRSSTIADLEQSL